MNERFAAMEDQSSKVQEQFAKTSNRVKELEKENERLKKVER
jgi:cell division protein FtsB